jgi:hypothetical protein
MIPIAGAPLLSARRGLELAYPPNVGRFGSLASNRGLLLWPSPLPAPEEASDPMLALRGRGL